MTMKMTVLNVLTSWEKIMTRYDYMLKMCYIESFYFITSGKVAENRIIFDDNMAHLYVDYQDEILDLKNNL